MVSSQSGKEVWSTALMSRLPVPHLMREGHHEHESKDQTALTIAQLLVISCQLPPTACHPRLTTHGLPPTACHPRLATHGLPPTAYHPRLATHSLPPTAYHPRLATHGLPPTACHPRLATHGLPSTAYHPCLAMQWLNLQMSGWFSICVFLR